MMMPSPPQLLKGKTFHGRKGPISNAFTYGVDYVLIDPAAPQGSGPRLFSRNRGNLTSVHDSDHGGAPRAGLGLPWARGVLAAHDLDFGGQVLLLTQPRVLGHVFNPVSFWLCYDTASALRVVIAEVSNTFGDRHSYLCHRDDRAPIQRDDILTAQKIFHVSPFQPIAGGYRFRFDITAQSVGIWIDFNANDDYGLLATLTGRLVPLTNAAILATVLRRPLGARRVLALIHWQALKLFVKGARYHPHTAPPMDEVSR